MGFPGMICSPYPKNEVPKTSTKKEKKRRYKLRVLLSKEKKASKAVKKVFFPLFIFLLSFLLPLLLIPFPKVNKNRKKQQNKHYRNGDDLKTAPEDAFSGLLRHIRYFFYFFRRNSFPFDQ